MSEDHKVHEQFIKFFANGVLLVQSMYLMGLQALGQHNCLSIFLSNYHTWSLKALYKVTGQNQCAL